MVILNDQITISTSDLKEWGYLGEPKSGYIGWYMEMGKVFANIHIHVDVSTNNPFLQVRYMYQGNNVQYIVELVSDTSNLGNGKLWYFICPESGKRARKLYYFKGKFAHRNAYDDSRYRSQILSHKQRKTHQLFKGAFAEEKLGEKYFKTKYKGKHTAKYQSIIKKVEKAKGLDLDQLLG